jgi:hypothetical protein
MTESTGLSMHLMTSVELMAMLPHSRPGSPVWLELRVRGYTDQEIEKRSGQPQLG